MLLVPGNRFELPGGARLGYCSRPEPVLQRGPRASRPSPASVRLATFVLAVAGRVDAAMCAMVAISLPPKRLP